MTSITNGPIFLSVDDSGIITIKLNGAQIAQGKLTVDDVGKGFYSSAPLAGLSWAFDGSYEFAPNICVYKLSCAASEIYIRLCVEPCGIVFQSMIDNNSSADIEILRFTLPTFTFSTAPAGTIQFFNTPDFGSFHPSVNSPLGAWAQGDSNYSLGFSTQSHIGFGKQALWDAYAAGLQSMPRFWARVSTSPGDGRLCDFSICIKQTADQSQVLDFYKQAYAAKIPLASYSRPTLPLIRHTTGDVNAISAQNPFGLSGNFRIDLGMPQLLAASAPLAGLFGAYVFFNSEGMKQPSNWQINPGVYPPAITNNIGPFLKSMAAQGLPCGVCGRPMDILEFDGWNPDASFVLSTDEPGLELDENGAVVDRLSPYQTAISQGVFGFYEDSTPQQEKAHRILRLQRTGAWGVPAIPPSIFIMTEFWTDVSIADAWGYFQSPDGNIPADKLARIKVILTVQPNAVFVMDGPVPTLAQMKTMKQFNIVPMRGDDFGPPELLAMGQLWKAA